MIPVWMHLCCFKHFWLCEKDRNHLCSFSVGIELLFVCSPLLVLWSFVKQCLLEETFKEDVLNVCGQAASLTRVGYSHSCLQCCFQSTESRLAPEVRDQCLNMLQLLQWKQELLWLMLLWDDAIWFRQNICFQSPQLSSYTAMPYTEATQQALRAGVETVRLALESAPVPERPQKALSRYSRQDLLQVCSKSASVFPFLILAGLV